MMKSKLETKLELPQGVSASVLSGVVTLKGPKGEVSREFQNPSVKIKVDGAVMIFSSDADSKREKRLLNSMVAHMENGIVGVQAPYRYVLKVCSGHFPINVSISGEMFMVKNFLGEKSPRVLKLKKGVLVKIDGDQVVVESPNKELAGQMASDIELLTAKSNRDLRVFQDGIYMIEKAGEKVV